MKTFFPLYGISTRFELQIFEVSAYMDTPLTGARFFFMKRYEGVCESISLLANAALKVGSKTTKMMLFAKLSLIRLNFSKTLDILKTHGYEIVINATRVIFFTYVLIGTLFCPVAIWRWVKKEVIEAKRDRATENDKLKALVSRFQEKLPYHAKVASDLEGERTSHGNTKQALLEKTKTYNEILNPELSVFYRDYEAWKKSKDPELKLRLQLMYKPLMKGLESSAIQAVKMQMPSEPGATQVVNEVLSKTANQYLLDQSTLKQIKVELEAKMM